MIGLKVFFQGLEARLLTFGELCVTIENTLSSTQRPFFLGFKQHVRVMWF
uniref:Uncharacterized protein n=1 Tax=Physcomitrium patens TaxID=3218 RepID=A0A2K1KF35_PHYPA|nr:hypothetical protein PHYPA_008756 [Physcomitrium patens]